jgi:hypothetical protein
MTIEKAKNTKHAACIRALTKAIAVADESLQSAMQNDLVDLNNLKTKQFYVFDGADFEKMIVCDATREALNEFCAESKRRRANVTKRTDVVASVSPSVKAPKNDTTTTKVFVHTAHCYRCKGSHDNCVVLLDVDKQQFVYCEHTNERVDVHYDVQTKLTLGNLKAAMFPTIFEYVDEASRLAAKHI